MSNANVGSGIVMATGNTNFAKKICRSYCTATFLAEKYLLALYDVKCFILKKSYDENNVSSSDIMSGPII